MGRRKQCTEHYSILGMHKSTIKGTVTIWYGRRCARCRKVLCIMAKRTK